jgi:hypothetical protein
MRLASNLCTQLFFFCVFLYWYAVSSNPFGTYCTGHDPGFQTSYCSKRMNIHISRERTSGLCVHANLSYRAFYIGCRNQGRDSTYSGIILSYCFSLFFVSGDAILFFLRRCRRCMCRIQVLLFLCSRWGKGALLFYTYAPYTYSKLSVIKI